MRVENREKRDGINRIWGVFSELLPSLKEKCQRLVSDCNLSWESRGYCAFDHLWEKLPGEFLDPRAFVDSVLEQPGGPQEGKGERWPEAGVLNSATSATSSLQTRGGQQGNQRSWEKVPPEPRGLDPAELLFSEAERPPCAAHAAYFRPGADV